MADRMFPFITCTWNPIAGGSSVEDGQVYACPYRCSYCWARKLINDRRGHLEKKYTGPFRLHERAMKRRFKEDDFPFVQDMSDIGAPGIPRGAIIDVFEHIAFFKDTDFLMLTKNPRFYRDWRDRIPANAVLGATIETDLPINFNISRAPDPFTRTQDMMHVGEILPNRRFVSIEPIMDFSWSFADRLKLIRPWAVAVGYDNYGHELPEPSLHRVEALIRKLEDAGIAVYRKTIREAWDH